MNNCTNILHRVRGETTQTMNRLTIPDLYIESPVLNNHSRSAMLHRQEQKQPDSTIKYHEQVARRSSPAPSNPASDTQDSYAAYVKTIWGRQPRNHIQSRSRIDYANSDLASDDARLAREAGISCNWQTGPDSKRLRGDPNYAESDALLSDRSRPTLIGAASSVGHDSFDESDYELSINRQSRDDLYRHGSTRKEQNSPQGRRPLGVPAFLQSRLHGALTRFDDRPRSASPESRRQHREQTGAAARPRGVSHDIGSQKLYRGPTGAEALHESGAKLHRMPTGAEALHERDARKLHRVPTGTEALHERDARKLHRVPTGAEALHESDARRLQRVLHSAEAWHESDARRLNREKADTETLYNSELRRQHQVPTGADIKGRDQPSNNASLNKSKAAPASSAAMKASADSGSKQHDQCIFVGQNGQVVARNSLSQQDQQQIFSTINKATDDRTLKTSTVTGEDSRPRKVQFLDNAVILCEEPPPALLAMWKKQQQQSEVMSCEGNNTLGTSKLMLLPSGHLHFEGIKEPTLDTEPPKNYSLDAADGAASNSMPPALALNHWEKLNNDAAGPLFMHPHRVELCLPKERVELFPAFLDAFNAPSSDEEGKQSKPLKRDLAQTAVVSESKKAANAAHNAARTASRVSGPPRGK